MCCLDNSLSSSASCLFSLRLGKREKGKGKREKDIAAVAFFVVVLVIVIVDNTDFGWSHLQGYGAEDFQAERAALRE